MHGLDDAYMSKLVRPRQRPLRRVPAVLIGGLSASLASIFLFGKISDEILEREAMVFDTRLVHLARKLRKSELDRNREDEVLVLIKQSRPCRLVPLTAFANQAVV